MSFLVRVTRRRDALEGQTLRVLGRLRRRGVAELLVALPDGTNRVIPQAWTDADPAARGLEAETLGSYSCFTFARDLPPPEIKSS